MILYWYQGGIIKKPYRLWKVGMPELIFENEGNDEKIGLNFRRKDDIEEVGWGGGEGWGGAEEIEGILILSFLVL